MTDEAPRTFSEKELFTFLVQAAHVDGRMQESERELLMERARELRLRPLQALAVIDRLSVSPPGEEIIPTPSDPETREWLLYSLCEIVWVDQELSPEELQLLEKVRKAFDLDPGELEDHLDTIRLSRSGRMPQLEEKKAHCSCGASFNFPKERQVVRCSFCGNLLKARSGRHSRQRLKKRALLVGAGVLGVVGFGLSGPLWLRAGLGASALVCLVLGVRQAA